MRISPRFVSLGALALTLGCSSSTTTDGGPNCGVASTLCGSICVDLQEDELNCGACSNACDAGSVCSLGACATTCETGLTACGASCKDLQHDNVNCGTCGTTCDTTQRCSVGTCQSWEQVSDGGPTTHGLVNYTPAGADLLVSAANGSSIWQFHIADGGWSEVASGTIFPGGYGYAARGGNNLYWLSSGNFYAYPGADGGVDVTANADIPATEDNQNTMDDSNNVWTVASNGQIVAYNLDAGTVRVLDGGAGVPGNGDEPRIAWDSLTHKLYFGDYDSNPFYSLDPATSAVTQLVSFPDTDEGMNDAFCSDHRGNVFTVNSCGDNNSLYTYDVIRGIWNVSYMPFPLDCSGSCSVTGDGYLYMMDDSGNLYRLRVF